MNDQIKQEQHDGDSTEPQSNLIHIDTDGSAQQARDINAKIDGIDHNLAHLNSELDSIRDSVDEGLEKLGDNDLDLRSKVSDTYKRLGELDNTYKSLSAISARIHDEINRLTNDVDRVASESSAELEKLEATSEVHNAYMVKQSESLAQRVDGLATDANESRTRLQLSIKDVHHTVLTAERKLIEEIDSLAGHTRQRDDELARKYDAASVEIQTNAARIIKLNKVDEALANRAEQLENTTNELDADLNHVAVSVDMLTQQAANLTDNVTRILSHTEELQRMADENKSGIARLQQRFSDMTAELIDLGDNEKKHFRTSLVLLLLVAVVVGVLYYKQEGDSVLLNERVAERSSLVDQEMASNQQQVNQQLSTLNADLNDKIVMLQDEVESVNRQVATLDDRTSSLDGRMSVDSPLGNFGGDNTVHGAHWLRELPQDNYMIQIAVVPGKQQLYEIADSYSSYLRQPVAYYQDERGMNIMLYGNFDNQAAAAAAARRLPYRIGDHYPTVRQVASIQQMI